MTKGEKEMILLPKDLVVQFVEELEVLLEAKEKAVDTDEAEKIRAENSLLEEQIESKRKEIDALYKEIDELKAKFKTDPIEENKVDEDRIEEIINLLVLSGFYKKVTKPDGEYLEETGLYKEEIENSLVKNEVEEVEELEVVEDLEGEKDETKKTDKK